MRISDWSSDVCSSDLRQVTAFFRRRRWLTALLVLSLLMVGTAAWLFANARAMPVVRRLDVALPFPADAPRRPVPVALLTARHLPGDRTGAGWGNGVAVCVDVGVRGIMNIKNHYNI